MITLHAPQETLQKIGKYIGDTHVKCLTGKTTYNLFSNNCVQFIQRALEAGEIQADYLSAFRTTDYLSHLDEATLFSMLTSKEPIIHPSESTTSLSPFVLDRSSENEMFDFVDNLPRKEIGEMLSAVTKTFVYNKMINAIPEIPRVTMRLASRIQQISMAVIFGIAAASG